VGKGQMCGRAVCEGTELVCAPSSLDPSSATCTDAPGPGQRCVEGFLPGSTSSTAFWCADGTFCDDLVKTCTKLPAEGETWGAPQLGNIDWICGDGLYCDLAGDASKRCRKLPVRGEPCSSRIACASGHTCSSGEGGAFGTCIAIAEEGEPCGGENVKCAGG